MAGAAALILLVGLVDQIPVGVRPSYATTRASLESAQGFVNSMQAALPDGAMVFEYPVTAFPEAGPTRALPDYSLAVPYILGDGSLRYSYGGIRGREADWQTWWSQQPMPQQLRGLAAAGFDAISVDGRAYLAKGAAFKRYLVATLGPPAGASRDGEQAWFDLRPLRRSLARSLPRAQIATAGRLITHGIVPSFSGDVGSNRAGSDRQDRWIGAAGGLHFHNPLGHTRRAVAEGDLLVAAAGVDRARRRGRAPDDRPRSRGLPIGRASAHAACRWLGRRHLRRPRRRLGGDWVELRASRPDHDVARRRGGGRTRDAAVSLSGQHGGPPSR